MKEKSTKPERKEFYHQEQRSKRSTRSYMKFVGITTVLMIGLMFSIVYINSKDDSKLSQVQLTPETRLEQYHKLILTGDQSLQDGEYHIAASKYRNALQLMPKDSIATLRLISASDLDCLANNENCGESDQLLSSYVEN